MKKKKHVISRVLPGSIGEELELEPGDILAEINHQLVEDVFDYRYFMNDEYIELLIEKPMVNSGNLKLRRITMKILESNSRMA
mgnify:FL=1